MAKTTKPRSVELVDPTQLRLDSENPRFPIIADGKAKEVEITRHLLDEADLRELVESIGSNGYLNFEPVIVIKEKNDLVVVEGNRRVAAIKLLVDGERAKTLKVEIPKLSSTVLATLKAITAIKIEDRIEARQFIGFKHINGPHKWDSYAKARFATNWFDDEAKQGVKLEEIAQRLGDRHDTIARLVHGIRVLDQAVSLKVFSLDSRDQTRPFAFSHLYTALTRAGVRSYLGLPEQWRNSATTATPVPKANKEQLRRLMLWLYGNDDDKIEPVVTSQNPHVKMLAEVLEHASARLQFESSGDLKKSYAVVNSRERRFQDRLLAAHSAAEEAQALVDAYVPEKTLFASARELSSISANIVASMERKK